MPTICVCVCTVIRSVNLVAPTRAQVFDALQRWPVIIVPAEVVTVLSVLREPGSVVTDPCINGTLSSTREPFSVSEPVEGSYCPAELDGMTLETVMVFPVDGSVTVKGASKEKVQTTSGLVEESRVTEILAASFD